MLLSTIVSTMTRIRPLILGILAPLIAMFVLVGCSSTSGSQPAASEPAASESGSSSGQACPSTPVNVVVSVDQWGDIVSQLGGACAKVTTVLASSSVDPHDYEPNPSDAASFADAQMVVVNGVDYDDWASKLAATSAPAAPVVDAGMVTNTPDGGNPHLWYSPAAVVAMANAVTAELTKLNGPAGDYYKTQRVAFDTSLQPYHDLISKIKAGATGKTYAATEGVFDYLAKAVGLVDKTPSGYQKASANESDPSPADIAAFNQALADGQVNVLIYNTQTEGSIPEQIRAAAEKADVSVVEVTETVPPGQTSFVAWQVEQLTALAKALGVTV